MDIKGIKKVTPILLKYGIVPYWHGKQGVGKTSVAHQIGEEMEFDSVIPLELGANSDASDIVGLLDKVNGKHFHTRPDWMPTEGRHLIFLDEFNRAPGEVYQTMYTLLTEGRIKSHKLPKECRIIAAANYNSNSFTVSNTKDDALKSRFAHLHFSPTVEEIVSFIEKRGTEGHKMVAEFLRAAPQFIGKTSENTNIYPDPDPRAWDSKIGYLLNENLDDELLFEVLSGMIGPVATSTFFTWRQRDEKPLNISDILENYQFQKDRVLKLSDVGTDRRFDVLNVPIDQLIENIKNNGDYLSQKKYLENLKLFLLDLPSELVLKVVKFFSKPSDGLKIFGRKEIVDDNEYTSKLTAIISGGEVSLSEEDSDQEES